MTVQDLFAAPRPPSSIVGRLRLVSWPIVGCLCLIAGIGVMSLYSVADGNMAPWADRHAVRFLLALALLVTVAVLPLRLWAGLAYPTYLGALVLLALVPLIGTEAMGARRWLQAGGVTLQPSEVMKIALVAALARYYQSLPPERISHPLYVAVPMIAIACPVILTLKQPDLGTSVLFAATGLGLMFLAGVNLLYFAGVAAAAIVAAPTVWNGLHDYQRRRIEIFLDADRDPLGAGYHISQSKIALGSGGLTGKGFMQGTQAMLDFLPEKHTDFIFTMYGEEWGYVGTIALIGLFVLLLTLLLRLTIKCENQFGRLLIGGAALVVFLYAFINMAMAAGIVPVVGVPLPLVSYGGTSMVTVMFGVGLALCASVHRAQRFGPGDLGRFF